MKKYNCLKALGLSFYSGELYRDVAKNWGAGVIFYLLTLVALCSIFEVFSIQQDINANFENDAGSSIDKLAMQFPLITLRNNGTIETTENRPYFIYDPDDKKLLMVIDTSGKYTTLENQSYDFLLTKTQYMTRKKNGAIQINHWPTGVEYVAHPDEIKETIKKWSTKLWVIIFPIFFIPVFLWRLMVAGFYAIFGKLFSKIIGFQLEYFKILGLTIVALTPSMIVKTVLDLLQFSFPHETLFFFLLTLAYLFFAVKVNKDGDSER